MSVYTAALIFFIIAMSLVRIPAAAAQHDQSCSLFPESSAVSKLLELIEADALYKDSFSELEGRLDHVLLPA